MALPNSEVSSFEKPSPDAMGEVSFEDPSLDPMEEEEDDEEAQALYDALHKKLAMSLDDLIKMSKKDAASNGSSRRRRRHHPRRRRPNKAPSTAGNALHQGNDGRVEQYMDARSIIRQRVLERRRSIPATTDQFPAVGGTSDAARDQVQISTRDALFATMKHQRMRAHSQSQQQHQRGSQRGQHEWWLGENGPYAPNATVLRRSVKVFRMKHEINAASVLPPL